jgi:hypothetical protein
VTGESGIDPASRRVGQQAKPAEARLALQPGGDVVGQGDDFVRRCEDEFARVQDERLAWLALHQPGQVGLLLGGVDVGIPVVLEDPKEAVHAYVHAGRLDQSRVERVEHHPALVELDADITIGEEHAPQLTEPAWRWWVRLAVSSSVLADADVRTGAGGGLAGWGLGGGRCRLGQADR